MKQKINLLTFLVLTSLNLFSQIKITGKITNLNNKPIEFAEILLLTKDSIALKSEMTNEKGSFQTNIKQGDYVLQIRQLGKILYNKELIIKNDLDLGIIKITQNKQQLQEVIITSKKKLIERKVDRLIFNVENSISATGGDAVDALKITPSIHVQNDKISMIGKSGMSIMVDERLIQLSGDDLINFLKTIPSDNIKSIEVITAPPAKYSAEGNSGLVNIKLKKAKKDSWSASVNSVYRQMTFPAGSLGGTLNYDKNKVTMVLNSTCVIGDNQGVEKSKIEYPILLWNSETKGKYSRKSISNRFGLDYQLTKKWSTGIQYIGSNSKPNINDEDLTNLSDKNTNSNNGIIKTQGNSIRKRNLNSINWHSNIALDTLGKSIGIDFDYLNFKSNNNRNYYSSTTNSTQIELPNGFYSANNLTDQKVDNYSLQINIEYPMKWANLNYGSKISYSKTNNEVNYFNTTTGTPIYDPTQSNLFEYKENTQAFYFSGNKKFLNNKLEIQLGLRMENTQTDGNSITLNQMSKNNITKFFPTTYLSYTPNENNNFSINYSKRITRPSFNELNPFRWYSTPYSYSEGNPYLQPSYAHNLEINYSFKDYLYTSLMYSKEIDNFGQVSLLNNNDYIQKVSRLNYFNNYTIGLQQVYVFKKIKWLESQNSFSTYFQHSDSKIYPITPKTNEGYGASITTANTITLNKEKTILTSFEFQHNFPHQSSDIVYNYSTTQLNLSLKMLFLQKNLQITITGNNIFKAYDFNNSSTRNGVTAIYNGYYDTRYIRFNLLYKFGNSKINVNQRQISNEDEKNRTN